MAAELSIREANQKDFESVVDYFLGEDSRYHIAMGVDKSKMPDRERWLNLIREEYKKPIEKTQLYYLIWCVDHLPIGHCNVNRIIWGQEAYMHLHVWNLESRGKGHGADFVRMCIPRFFEKFHLKEMICEPYALNPGPNKILKAVGFTFIKEYEGVPGWIGFYQPINRWVLTL